MMWVVGGAGAGGSGINDGRKSNGDIAGTVLVMSGLEAPP